MTSNDEPTADKPQRIDLTELENQFRDGLNWDDSDTMDLIADLKRCYEVIDSLQHEMYGFKEALWAEALCDESENVVGVEAYPGDQKREKKVFFISCDLVDEMYVFFQQHGRLDLSKNASQ